MIKNQILQYTMGLLLSTEVKKTTASLARTMETKETVMWKSLKDSFAIKLELYELVMRTFGPNAILYLILDDTIIAKIYSQYIEGTSNNHNSSKHQMEWGLCSVVAMITDGKTAIPVNLRNWTQEEIAKESYKSKMELAKELIEELTQKFVINTILMDGLYAHVEMIQWLNARNLKFEMRLHANRVIEAENKEVAQLRNHSQLQLKGRQRFKTIKAIWKNIPVYITVIKRFDKKGNFHIIFQVSNYDASAKRHAKVYSYRWKIEKFFRTAKQHLGLTHCQSRKLDLQINHQLNVFLVYTILQKEQRRQRLDSPEKALKAIKKQNCQLLQYRIQSSYQIFGAAYA